MNDPQIDFAVHRYKAARSALIAAHGFLDEQTLADTLEGVTDLADILADDLRSAIEIETKIFALKKRIADMSERMKRFQNCADGLRALVQEAMGEADLNKIVREDFTASLRNGPTHVVVIDEALIPESFWKTERTLRRSDLREELKNGAEIAGVTLSNPDLVLSVRTK